VSATTTRSGPTRAGITVIHPPGKLNLPAWRELWASREVLVRFAQRDLILRYRQTVVGVAWVLIQPLAGAGIFSVVFGSVAKLSSDGTPYFVFSLSGLLAWTLFSSIATRASGTLVANQALVSKVFFPRLLVPLSAVASSVVDFVVGLALAIVLIIAYPRVGLHPAILLVPVWVLLIIMLATGIGTAASAVMVRYRDVAYVLPWVFQVLLYGSPVAYALSSVPANLRWIYEANPITWFLEAMRWSLIGSAPPATWQVVGLVVGSPLVLVAGVLVFQRFEREFADVI
jgi:lipopolysaccharide transport system permease protein